MSILIKGMEMPVTCCHCPLMGYDPEIEWDDGGRETQGAYICVITHELIDNTKREEHCPLVLVPPHGRVIDADAFAQRIEEEAEKFVAMNQYDSGLRAGYRAAKKAVNLAPTIIPAEEGE